MPYIHIKSLPFEEPKPISDILCRVNRDFALRVDVPLEHVHSTWEYFQPGHFAKGDVSPKCQPDGFHSLLVTLVTPNYNDVSTCGMMLEVLAACLAKHTKIPLRKIFICHRQVRSGMVFDDGELVYW